MHSGANPVAAFVNHQRYRRVLPREDTQWFWRAPRPLTTNAVSIWFSIIGSKYPLIDTDDMIGEANPLFAMTVCYCPQRCDARAGTGPSCVYPRVGFDRRAHEWSGVSTESIAYPPAWHGHTEVRFGAVHRAETNRDEQGLTFGGRHHKRCLRGLIHAPSIMGITVTIPNHIAIAGTNICR